MVHHSELLRSPSDAATFAAPVGNDRDKSADCGIDLLPWLTSKLKLERYNRNTVFVCFLCALSIFHASSTSYFAGTAKVWRLNYGASEVLAEWIVYLSPILSGFFALVLSHYGNIIHRPCYIGGLAMLHAVAGWLLILPELYHPLFNYLNTTAVAEQTCKLSTQNSSQVKVIDEEFINLEEERKYIALSIMAVYQLFHGLAFVSMVSHGVAHIDDGGSKYMTPTYICLLVAVTQIGRFIGLNLTLIPITFNRHIFFSIAWLTTMSGIFTFGFLISLFSKLPQRILLKKGVNSLLQRQSTNPTVDEQPQELGLSATICSLFSSNHLLLNTIAATFMHVAIVNFNAMREEFFRSRFVNFADYFDYRFSFYNVSGLLFTCIVVLVMSQIFYRRRPTTKFFIVWLIVTYVLIMGFFSSYAFIKCEDKTSLFKYKQIEDWCNYNCQCSLDVFNPVCLDGKTYYSACFAGCKQKNSGTFSDCACDTSPVHDQLAVIGSCNQDKCQVVGFLAEANSMIGYALAVSAYIVHVIISLRSVSHHQSRSSSIGLLLVGVHLLPYIPFKFIYEVIKATHCEKLHKSECFIFTEHFALVISLVTIGFMLLGIITAICMLRGAKKVEMYKRRGSKHLGVASMRLNVVNDTNNRLNALNEEEEESDLDELASDRFNNAQFRDRDNNTPTANQSQTENTDEIDSDEEQLKKTEHHERSMRRSLHQVLSTAARISMNGSISEPSPGKVQTPRPVRVKRQPNFDYDGVESDQSVNASHAFNVTHTADVNQVNNVNHALGHKTPPLQHPPTNGSVLESEGFDDSDIDLELIKLEFEEPPKCLNRNSSFNETNL